MRNYPFFKYHALGNDFVILEDCQLSDAKLSLLTLSICDRNTGVGADGVLAMDTKSTDQPIARVVNSDGGFAEKSGNGLRIVGFHTYLKDRRRKKLSVQMNNESHEIEILKADESTADIRCYLPEPIFDTKMIPMKSPNKFMINAPLKIGGLNFPVTSLSVGNPHCVLFVEDFDFEWQELGAEIESHKAFPERTNVEFVRILTRGRIELRDWERGAGPTSSSGTGAAAAVSAGVMTGQLDRKCQVNFESGFMNLFWNPDSKRIELSGPVTFICEGTYHCA